MYKNLSMAGAYNIMPLISCVVCLFVFLLAGNAALAEVKIRRGHAYDLKTEQLLYTEVHHETWDGATLLKDDVTYLLPDGGLLASKTVDYTHSQLTPDFTLDNHLSGHYEMARKTADELIVTFIRKTGDKTRTARLTIPDNALVDAGFDRLIAQHWDKLTAGERIKKAFLVPSLLRFVTFRIYQQQATDTLRRMVIEPDNFFVNLIAGKVVLDYALTAPQLRRFTGISNMRNQRGDNYRVSIIFPDEDTSSPR